MRDLYLRSRAIQTLAAILFPLAGATLVLSITSVAHPVALVAGLPLILPMVQFALTPALRLFGLHRYHSTMLKATIRTPQYYELHGGAIFDYLLTVGHRRFGPVAARRVMASYLEGLLDIAEEVERGRLGGTIEIVGTSYFFRDSTLKRLGFTIRPTNWRLRLNLWLHLFDVAVLYSISKGRPALPHFERIKSAVIRGDVLVRQRPAVAFLLESLRRERTPAPSPRAVA